MIKNPIFIPYEIKTRELDGKLLLISHLLNAGFYQIYFGSRGACKIEAQNWANGIYILKSVAKEEEEFYRRLKANGFLLVLLHVEGGIQYKDNRSSILSIFNPELMKYVDINFVFGEEIKEDIRKYIGEEAYNKTIVSGEPRFDLMKPKYFDFFEKEVKTLKARFDSFILINTSFGLANPISGNEKTREYYLNEKTITNEARERIFTKISYLNEILKEYIGAISIVAKKYPQLNFVVRPHGEESIETYLNEFKDLDNVIVAREGNVATWIFASIGVIHLDCTTGMEAKIAEKPVISFLPKENSLVLAWLPIKLSKKVHNTEQLSTEIQSILENRFENKINEDTRKIWTNYINNVKEEASETITEILLVRVQQLGIAMSNNKSFSWEIVLSLFRLIKRCIHRKVSSQVKFGTLNTREIRSKIEVLRKINSHYYNYKIKIYDNTLADINIPDKP